MRTSQKLIRIESLAKSLRDQRGDTEWFDDEREEISNILDKLDYLNRVFLDRYLK